MKTQYWKVFYNYVTRTISANCPDCDEIEDREDFGELVADGITCHACATCGFVGSINPVEVAEVKQKVKAETKEQMERI
jgi:Zn ribbon nucleic-acid-binding protein